MSTIMVDDIKEDKSGFGEELNPLGLSVENATGLDNIIALTNVLYPAEHIFIPAIVGAVDVFNPTMIEVETYITANYNILEYSWFSYTGTDIGTDSVRYLYSYTPGSPTGELKVVYDYNISLNKPMSGLVLDIANL